MTSAQQAQKLHTDDVHCPNLGSECHQYGISAVVLKLNSWGNQWYRREMSSVLQAVLSVICFYYIFRLKIRPWTTLEIFVSKTFVRHLLLHFS